jgi:sugar O-acyltransferase (sialic acid O-acetyltransferase NeuD family)
MFVAVSYAGLNRLRAEKFQQARARGYRIAHYLSTRATVWPGFEPRPNQFILEDNTIQPFARVGENVTLWSGNHIGHHSTIGDHVFVASHVVVSGNVTVNERCFLGVNAAIRDGVTVGAGCLIGAGALVMKDTGDNALFAPKATEKSPVPASRAGL